MAPLIGSPGVSATLRRQLPYFGQGAISLFYPAPNALSYYSVRYGKLTDTLIALAVNGGGNQIIRSKDRGISFASIAEPNTRQWTGLDTDGRGRWVGVAQSGLAAGMAMYSDDDGLTWHAATMPSNNAWQDVCWAGGYGASARFVAVANTGVAAGQVAISTDGGQTWAVSAGGAAVTRAWNAINYGNGVLIAVAYDGGGDQTMWSNDGGDSWNGVAEAVTRQWDGIIYSPELARWVAVAYDSLADNIQYSDDDGQSWIAGTCNSINPDWSEVAWGNDRFVAAAGNQGRMGISPDGRIFNHIPDGTTTANSNKSICFAYDRFVAVGTVIRIC
jgi:hypothetical protein